MPLPSPPPLWSHTVFSSFIRAQGPAALLANTSVQGPFRTPLEKQGWSLPPKMPNLTSQAKSKKPFSKQGNSSRFRREEDLLSLGTRASFLQTPRWKPGQVLQGTLLGRTVGKASKLRLLILCRCTARPVICFPPRALRERLVLPSAHKDKREKERDFTTAIN